MSLACDVPSVEPSHRAYEPYAHEVEVLEHDRAVIERLGAGVHLDEWLSLYEGLAILRRMAMHFAHTNRPEGKAYQQELARLYKDAGIDTKDKTIMHALAAVVWIGDSVEHMTLLREMREAMTPGERSRLNSPISARQRITKQLLQARETQDKTQTSPFAQLKQDLAAKDREIAELKQRIAKFDGGSQVDFARDSADDIAAVVARLSKHKANAIYAAIGKLLKEV
jgi:hypothetical protein